MECQLAACNQKIARLEAEIEKLRKMALTDELTGLFNRRYLNLEIARIKEMSLPQKRRKKMFPTSGICLILMDMMGFKSINDTYGHNEGDNAIKFVARIIRDVARKNDVIVRPNEGGDEFVILLYPTEEMEAQKFILRLSNRFSREFFTVGKKQISIEAAFGYHFRKLSRNFSLQKALEIADKAMYEDKQERKKKNH